MVYRDYRCTVPPKVGTSHDGGETETIDRTHLWDWNYVPRVAQITRNAYLGAVGSTTTYADVGGKLVGRCKYCGATWEESSDGDD